MRNVLKIITLFLLSYTTYSQEIINKKFDSKELQSSRDLKIFIPEGYQEENTKNYPLAIVIDGEHLFDNYVANAKLFSMTDKAPKQIVVGIYIHKTRKEDTYFNKNIQNLTGGNIRFMNFIKNEILPYMEGSYRTSPFITVIGQGSSANIVTSFLKSNTLSFNAYIAVNPTFPDNILEKIMSYQLDRLSAEDNTFYYYINNASFFGKEKQKTLAQLNNYFTSLNVENFNFKFDKMNSPNYISAISEAVPRAMSQVFQLYSAISKEEFDKNIKHLDPIEAITYLENKYLDIDYLFGSNLGVREKDIFAIEKVIIEKENGEYLKEFGEMILNVYPESHIGDYYMGLYFEKKEKFNLALDNYRIAYGKMDDSNPNKDAFYSNIERLLGGR